MEADLIENGGDVLLRLCRVSSDICKTEHDLPFGGILEEHGIGILEYKAHMSCEIRCAGGPCINPADGDRSG